jgi:hypothetical protein
MTASGYSTTSWFATRGGRRYGIELGLLLLAKLALLTALYFLFIAPQPRADTSPGALQNHLLDAKKSAAPAGESRDRS